MTFENFEYGTVRIPHVQQSAKEMCRFFATVVILVPKVVILIRMFCVVPLQGTCTCTRNLYRLRFLYKEPAPKAVRLT